LGTSIKGSRRGKGGERGGVGGGGGGGGEGRVGGRGQAGRERGASEEEEEAEEEELQRGSSLDDAMSTQPPVSPRSLKCQPLESEGERGKMAARDTTGSSDEDAMFACVVCLNDVRACTSAIWQCPEGHMICCVCFERVGGVAAPCPSCRMLLGRMRCRVLEKQRDHQLKRANEAPAGAATQSAGAPGPP
jgi:hypothetical protein